jgi:L-threonylcarbamoyladenylate synthase
MAIRDLPTANPSDSAAEISLNEAAAALRRGELVVFPTETFYAIGADPMNANALAAILRLKGRERDKPIALIAADTLSAFKIAREVPPQARLLAEKFWPGPLTIVLPAQEGLNEALLGPTGGIGVRVSPDTTARGLAAALGGLITATSANLSGQAPARTLIQARQSLGARVSVYLDGGALNNDSPSTVIEFEKNGSFRIGRAGAVDPAAIIAVLTERR